MGYLTERKQSRGDGVTSMHFHIIIYTHLLTYIINDLFSPAVLYG